MTLFFIAGVKRKKKYSIYLTLSFFFFFPSKWLVRLLLHSTWHKENISACYSTFSPGIVSLLSHSLIHALVLFFFNLNIHAYTHTQSPTSYLPHCWMLNQTLSLHRPYEYNYMEVQWRDLVPALLLCHRLRSAGYR